MKDQVVRRGVSNIIANIAGIEIPLNQWTEVVVNLSKNIDNENLSIKKTAIETIGFICETLAKLIILLNYFLESGSLD